MSDDAVMDRIRELVDDEHRLRERLYREGGDDPEERRELQRTGELLDQCWDLLRQRRAKEDSGADPDAASLRPVDVVERYRQ